MCIDERGLLRREYLSCLSAGADPVRHPILIFIATRNRAIRYMTYLGMSVENVYNSFHTFC